MSAQRIFTLFAVALLVLQLTTSVLSPVVGAQAAPADESTPSDRIQGQEIMNGDKEEYYYWDMEEKDGQQVPVIYGRGGQYTEPVKFENAPGQPNTHFYYLKDEWLPVTLPDSWCGKGIHLKEKGGHPSNLVLRIVENGDPGYDAAKGPEFPTNQTDYLESVYGRSIGAFDAIGDDSGGVDSYEFQWRAMVDITNPDDKKFVKEVNIAQGAFNGAKNILRPLLNNNASKAAIDAALNSLGLPPGTGSVVKEVLGDKTKEIEDCTYVFHENFNVSLPHLSPFDVTDPNAIQGKLLGKRGMKFEDWLRRFNNLRDYFALSSSATRQTTIHCQNFQDKEGCINRLTTKFQRCYARASGLTTTADFDGSSNPIISFADAIKLFPNSGSSLWDHTIRANLAPFATCFGGERYAKNDRLDQSFRTEQHGIDFGEWIAFGTTFPEQLFPYDIEEVTDPTMPSAKAETTCSLGSMGWILCPAFKFFANVADKLFTFIRQWLVIPPLLAGKGMAAYIVWEHMRNLANVLFAILILALVIMYAAGGMLSNYNIRIMLPRIIVTGILINISFYLCSFLVDVSNVAGSSLYTLIRELTPPKSGVSGFSTWESIVTHIAFAGGGAVLTGTALVVGLAAMVPMLITSLIAMVIALLALLLRQAVVIILVIVAPLAFAMQLLPGTASWFQKWKKMFSQMLLLYPVIAIVFAGAYFASNIVQGQATEQGGVLLAIFALALQVIPLFLTPLVLKFGGNVLNKFGGTIKSAVKSPTDKLNKAASTFADDRKDIKNLRAAHRQGLSRVNPIDAIRRSRMRREHKYNYQDSQRRSAQARRVAESRLMSGVAKAGGGISETDLKSILDKAASERIQLAKISIDDQAAKQFGNDVQRINTEMLKNLDSDDMATAAASAQRIVESGDVDSINQMIDKLHTLQDSSNTTMLRDRVGQIVKNSTAAKTNAHLRDPDNLNAIQNGSATTRSMYQHTANRPTGGYSDPQTAIRESPQSIAEMQNHLNDTQLRNFVNAFNTARSRDRSSGDATVGATEAVAALDAALRARGSGSGP